MSRPTSFDAIVMRPDEFRLLRDLIAARTGVHFADDGKSQLERRLRERLLALGLSSYGEYGHYLRFNARAEAEWEEAMELVTTNETYLFREAYQLRAFRDEVLPLLANLAKTRRRLWLWSAGCSTGEEVYTLAILVAQSGLFEGWDVRIFGSDISKRCIAAARRGVYGAGSFRVTPPEVKRAWFTEHEGGFHVADRIRSMCHFGCMNLLDRERVAVLGRVDAVFCRNVLIYFDAHSRRRVIEMFHERLYAGGVLFLGHSESLLNVTTAFELLHLKEDLAYRKPMTGIAAP